MWKALLPPQQETDDLTLDTRSGSGFINLSNLTLTAQVGIPYDSSVLCDGCMSPLYLYSASPVLPFGLSFASPTSGRITGTPFKPPGNDYRSCGRACYAASAVTIVVQPKLSVSIALRNVMQADTSFASAVNITGGIGPFRFAIIDGSLPRGLEIDPVSRRRASFCEDELSEVGAIQGTASSTALTALTFEVTDAMQVRSTATGVFEVIAPPGGLSTGAIVGIAFGAMGFVE